MPGHNHDLPRPTKRVKAEHTDTVDGAHGTISGSAKSKGKDGGWTPEMRLALFDAFERVAKGKVGWDEVADAMGMGLTGKQCREQWQRAMAKRIRGALED